MMKVGTDLSFADDVRAGRVSTTQIAQQVVDAARQDRLGCFWALDEEGVLRAAARIDELVAGGSDPGPLAGVSVAVKDCFDVEGLPASGGVVVRQPRAAASDAEVVSRLRRSGALVVGKASMHQLAWGMTGQSPGFPA